MIRALILDDDELFGKTLADSLRRHQELEFAVTVTTTVADARHKVTESAQPFDVFLIDQRLGPGPDGIEVFQDLRRLSPDTEGIIFTGTDDPDVGLRAYRAGAHRYLHKPFNPQELIWILRSLRKWRDTQYERDWLKVLTEVAEEAQRAFSEHEVEHIVVQGGLRLGFERARLWRLNADSQMLAGASQVGNVGLDSFAGLHIPVAESPYLQRALEQRDPVLFDGLEVGPGYLDRHFAGQGYEPPVGEWVHIPLWAGERCLGVLSLDNTRKPRPLRPEHRRVLSLWGRQVAAALERARLHEREARKSKELEVLNQIGQRVAARAALEDLDTLLGEVHSQVGTLIDARNFMVVLLDEQVGQLDFRLHVEDNRIKSRHRRLVGTGLVGHLLARNEPLFLPEGDEDYVTALGIAGDDRPARCWLGVPLRVGDQTVGAIIVQSYAQAYIYSHEDLSLLTAVADQVAGAIQTARLKEQEAENSRRLAGLQRATEALMKLADENEDWLWHATLTAITAGYALSFSRAVLFLTEEGGTLLRGRMGIGHFEQPQPRHALDADHTRNGTFDTYLQHLRAGHVQPTPVEQAVRDWVLDISCDQGAFRQVLAGSGRVMVPSREVAQRLPPPFNAQFGPADYAVLPLQVGHKLLGLVVVDNAHTAEPLRANLLDQLETLLTQVALIVENMRQRQVRDKLITLNQVVMVEVGNRPLKETLTQICQAAQAVTAADSVSTYPFRAGGEQDAIAYDIDAVAATGMENSVRLGDRLGQKGFTAHILRAGTLAVNDVSGYQQMLDDQPLADQLFVQREQIRAFIGTAIYDVTTGEPSGVLYLNYRNPQTFTQQDLYQAEAFAKLTAVAIHNGRAGQQVRSRLVAAETQSQARGRELEILGHVLEEALKADTGEERVVRALLAAARDLLGQSDVRIGLLLRTWEQPARPAHEPCEVLRQYVLDPDGWLTQNVEQDIYRGIEGLALRTAQVQLVPDLRQEPWGRAFAAGDSEHTRSELDVPIKLDGQISGVFNIESPRVHAFTDVHQAMLERLAAAAALALDNVRRQEHLHNVLVAAQAVVEPRTLQSTLEAVSDVARRVAPGLSALTIWYQEPESKRILLGPHFGVHDATRIEQRVWVQDSAVRTVMGAAEPVWAPVAQHESRLRFYFIEDEQIESVAAFPLRADDEVVGAMFFNYRQHHAFTSEEKVLFPILAAIAAASVRDAARLEATQRESKRLHAAMAITEAVGTTLELDETLRKIMSKLRELFPHATPCVLTYDEAERYLFFTPASLDFYQIDNPEYRGLTRIHVDGPGIPCYIARRSLASKQVEVINVGDTHHLLGYMKLILNTRSELCLSLLRGEHLLGVLLLESQEPEAFDADDVALIRSVGQQVSFALDRAYQTAQLSFKTTVATTTGWAAEVAHDINREISLIRSRTYWLSEETGLSQAGQQYIQEIDESAARLAGILPGIGPRQFQSCEQLCFDEWIQQWVTEMVSKRGSPVTLRFESGCRGLSIQTYPIALQRVLRHLVHNALDATPEAGMLIVRTRRVDDARVEVQVEDTGPGVPDHLRQVIFQHPVTTKDRGGGLGLILVRLIVEQMGGAMRLLPFEAGRGAVFAFTLPIDRHGPEQEG